MERPLEVGRVLLHGQYGRYTSSFRRRANGVTGRGVARERDI
jgi:hypothetical protein